jgi:hypothetical protein
MKSAKVLVLALLIVMTAVPLVGAQQGVWDSSFNILNLGSTDASVTVNFYDDNGVMTEPACLRYVDTTCDLPNPFTLAAGAKEEIFLAAMGTDLPDGRYSVVVSADQPIAAIGQLVGNDSNNYYTGAYTGLEDDGQMEMYMPGIQAGFYGWDSHLSIQNLTASAQGVTVEFYTEGTSTVCHTETPAADVPAYSSWHLDTTTLDLSACDTGTDGFNGAAIVTSDAGPLAVIDNQTTTGTGYFEVAYSGFVAGSDMLYAPSVFRGAYPPGGWNTSFNILNTGAAAVTVTVTINASDNSYEISNSLDPLQGWFIYPPSDMPTLPVYEWEALSAVIDAAGGEVVAIINSANTLQQALTYNAMDAGGSTVAVPIVSRNYYGWDTAVAVQNMGPDDVVVHVVYSENANPYGTPWTGGEYDTPAIGSGESLQLYQGNGDDLLFAATGDSVPETYTGGAILTITSGTGPIAAVVNTTNGPGQVDQNPGPGDWSTSFNAINQ